MSIQLADPEVSHDSLKKILKRWTPEHIKKMTLEEYSQVGNKDTFTYWIEYASDDNITDVDSTRLLLSLRDKDDGIFFYKKNGFGLDKIIATKILSLDSYIIFIT